MHFYILAGGQSRRFGRNKALEVIDGKTVIARIIAAIAPLGQIFLITNSPAEYAHLALPTLPDHYPGCGPLAGIHAGLQHSPQEWNFFLACDFPGLQSSVIQEILAAPRAAQIVLPATPEGLQPLCALWSKVALPAVENALQNQERRVHSILEKLQVQIISPSDSQTLFNLNTPQDLLKLQFKSTFSSID